MPSKSVGVGTETSAVEVSAQEAAIVERDVVPVDAGEHPASMTNPSAIPQTRTSVRYGFAVPFLLGALGAFVAFVVARALLHANELFCLSIRDGKSLVVRGVLPRSLHDELAEVVGARNALIRGIREGRAARLDVQGVDEATAQRLRNVFGISRYRDLKTLGAVSPGPRNLGQRLGWIWLAWWLD